MLDRRGRRGRLPRTSRASARRRSRAGHGRRCVRSSSRSCGAKSTISSRPPGASTPRRLGDRRAPGSAHNGAPGGGSRCRRAPSASGSAYMSPWRSSACVEPGLGELGAGEAQHFGAAVDAERVLGASRPNSSIIRPVPVPISTRRPIGRVAERARRSPPRPRFRRRGASASRPIRRHGSRNSARRAAARSARTAASRAASAATQGSSPSSSAQRSSSCEQRLDPRRAAPRLEEHPAAFLAALGEAGVEQDLHMARDARLALPEHLRQLADATAPSRAAARGCAAASDRPARKKSWVPMPYLHI